MLVTGAGRPFGERLAARLANEDSIDRVIAVDTVAPRVALTGRTEFVRADIAHPLIGKVLEQAGVNTVVHTGGAGTGAVGVDVLLAACERSRTVTRVVAESSTAVYPAYAGAPAVHGEGVEVHDPLETALRAFARHRRDVTVTSLRFADIVGAGYRSTVVRRLAGPIVGVLGFDPTLQLLHIDDALEVATQACLERHPGAVNVAGAGVLTLTQLVRRAGRTRIAAPPLLAGAQACKLRFGRVVDTTRLATRFGYLPRYSTAAAWDDALGAARRQFLPALALGVVGTAERLVRA